MSAALNGSDFKNITTNQLSMTSSLDPQGDYAFGFWLFGVLGTFVGIIGIFGNVCSIRVLSHKQMRSSPNFILIALACSDLVLIITSILMFGCTTIYPYSGYMINYYYRYQPYIAKVAYPISIIAQSISIYMTFLISMERFIAVCHPFRARTACNQTRTKFAICFIVTLSIVYNLPKFFEIVLLKGYDSEYGDFYVVRASALRINPYYIQIYINWAYFIVMNLFPLICITIFNLMIYRQVQIVNRMRIKLTASEMQDIKLTTMLFCVVIVFMSCNFLAVFTNILESFYHIHNDRLTKLSNFMVTVNSSVNFIIYVVLVRKFRIIFVKQLKSFFFIESSKNHAKLRSDQYVSVRRRTETETLTSIDLN